MRAKKSFGQHFLHDGRVLQAITRSLAARDDELVCEIGPGTGCLTERLVETHGVERILAVEMDRDMIAHLAQTLPGLRVVRADAARFDWSEVIDGPACLASNLPYNASTAIYFHLLRQHRHRFRRLVLMFQKEVAIRLLAKPGGKTYGPPSVITALLADARLVTTVKPGSFRPPPKVDSAVIAVDPLPTPRFGVTEEEVDAFCRFAHAVFAQRRKTLRNNVKPLAPHGAEAAFDEAEIDPGLRAEVVAPERLVKLWRAVVRLGS